MENDIRKLQKQYAALAYALGWTRSALGSVLDGDFSLEEVKRILEATATARIAAAIGRTDEDLSVFWDEFLSEEEKHRIKGYGNDQAIG